MHENINNTKMLNIWKTQAYNVELGRVSTNFKTNWIKLM